MRAPASDPTPAVVVDPALVERALCGVRADETMLVEPLPAPSTAPRRVERYVIAGFAAIVLVIAAGIALGSGHRDQAAPATARVEPAPPAPREDVTQAYRAGVQQFARGDTAAALAALQASLAADPDHSPSWRVLGFVHEKRGDLAEARAAYRRYLELAPGAEDAGAIRDRLERLGS